MNGSNRQQREAMHGDAYVQQFPNETFPNTCQTGIGRTSSPLRGAR